MRISELIKELDKIKDQHGDIDVKLERDDGLKYIDITSCHIDVFGKTLSGAESEKFLAITQENYQ